MFKVAVNALCVFSEYAIHLELISELLIHVGEVWAFPQSLSKRSETLYSPNTTVDKAPGTRVAIQRNVAIRESHSSSISELATEVQPSSLIERDLLVSCLTLHPYMGVNRVVWTSLCIEKDI